MIKEKPSKVPNTLRAGLNTYKPEMKKAIIMQLDIIRNLLPENIKNVPLERLIEIAEDKKYNDNCDYLEKAFSNPEAW